MLSVACPECKEPLLEPQEGDKTSCSGCKHEWELNNEHTKIKSVTLEVQNISIDPDVLFGARRPNG